MTSMANQNQKQSQSESRLDRYENIVRILNLANKGVYITFLLRDLGAITPERHFLIDLLVESGMLVEVAPDSPTLQQKRRKVRPRKKRGYYKTTPKGYKLLERLQKLYSLVGWSF